MQQFPGSPQQGGWQQNEQPRRQLPIIGDLQPPEDDDEVPHPSRVTPLSPVFDDDIPPLSAGYIAEGVYRRRPSRANAAWNAS